MLIFKSNDPDALTNLLSPTYLVGTGKQFNSRINSYPTRCADGTTACGIRQPVFVSLLNQGIQRYSITYSNDRPTEQEFTMIGPANTTGIIIEYQFSVNEPILIKDSNGEDITEQEYNAIAFEQDPPDEVCGSWRYIGAKVKKLEFYIEPGCTLKVVIPDGKEMVIRLAMPITQFYEEGGPKIFASLVAPILGQDVKNIRVVKTDEGSTIVDFFGIVDNTITDSQAFLEAQGIQFSNAFGNLALNG